MKQKTPAFLRELQSLWKSAMGLLLVTVLLLLPSLFAWFSLAANWDPIRNTQQIQAAVVCPESAWSQLLKDELAEEACFSWQFTSKDQALEGLRGGRYYAALILPEGFDGELTAVLQSGGEGPSIDCYVNQRRNAAIPSSLQSSGLLELRLRSCFSQALARALAELPELEGKPAESLAALLDSAAGELERLEASLQQMREEQAPEEKPVSAVPTASAAFLPKEALSTAALARSQAGQGFKAAGGEAAAHLETSRETSSALGALYRSAAASLEGMETSQAASMCALFQEGARRQDRILEALTDQAKSLRAGNALSAADRSQLVNMLDEAKGDAGYIARAYERSGLSAASVVTPVQKPAEPVPQEEAAVLAQLQELEALLASSRQRLEALRAKTEEGRSLSELLRQQPEAAGELLAAAVQFDQQRLYARENYGSALAPGYTSAALWLGAILLALFLRIPGEEPFLSRGLVFMLLSFLQATLLCIGELFFLRIQCANPFLFLLAGWTAAVVYGGMIYVLVFLLGRVGMALGVLLLTIQLAGATGIFPADMLPNFFRWIYQIMPFAWGTAALDETIGGVYTQGYLWNLLGLALVLGAFLGAGVLLKAPCRRMRQFLRRRLSEAEMF